VNVFLQTLQTTIVLADAVCCSFPLLAAEAFEAFFFFPPDISALDLFFVTVSSSSK
jgi:hypothetical protein